MYRNVASQKIALFAFDSTTGVPKTSLTTGATLVPYVSKDYGAVTALATATVTEMDATNAPGWYSFSLSQSETDGNALLFTGKSSTSNIYIAGQQVFTDPPNYTSTSIDSNGRVDVIKIAGTTQTARDIGASVLLAAGQKVDVDTIKTNPVVNGGTITFPTNSTIATTTGAVGSVTGAVGSVTGLTVSNLDTTISSRMATYTQPTGFLAATFPTTVASTTNITTAALGATERTAISDSLLARDIGSGSNAGSSQERTVRSALRFLRNKWVISGTTLTVNAEDDSTAMWTATVTATPGANPITANDPT